MFKKLLKKSMFIPYDDISVYPSINATKNAIALYCGNEGLTYEFMDQADNLQVKIEDIDYEVIREIAERGCYAIRIKEL